MSDDKDAKKRITQMINFILQEAREKGDEIRMKADEEFQIEKGRILNPERLKLNQEFDRKFKDLEIKQKIELSTQINKARLEVLEKRGELMKEVENDAYKRLSSLKSDKNKYKQLLKTLMIQGFIRIDEETVVVRVVKQDIDLAASIFDQAVSQYKQIWKEQVGIADPINASLDKSHFLPAAAVGGVSIYARNNKICLDNTLQARLTVCQQALMPILRGRLFGVVAHQGIIYEDEHKEDKKTASLRIDAIATYPIKSCAPIIMDKENDSFEFTEQGLIYDRSWMVINAETQKKLTQRQYPKMALIKPELTKTHLIVLIDNKKCEIALNGKDGDCGDQIAKLLTDFIGIECRLKKNTQKVQSWDSHPLLIVFQESIQSLNERILNEKNKLKYDYLRFRPNVLLSGLNAFDEETIKFLQLNDSKFICDINHWGDGCLNVTCVDYKTAKMDENNEPKNTLRDWKNSLFGLGLRTPSGKNNGTLTVGHKVVAMW